MDQELHELQVGTCFPFADWPNPAVPDVAAGVYTIWRGDEFIYVGMSGRGLRSRLNSHASGRRSGDQFCIYVADRLVLPGLSPEDITRIGRGELSLDALTREFIRRKLTYRFVTAEHGKAALDLEKVVKAGALKAGRPLLNPA